MSKWFKRAKRVAVIGTYRSGKTVVLTSLLNHLHYHDETKFRLVGDGGKVRERDLPRIRKFRTLKLPAGSTPFPYERFRDALVHNGEWPAKTTDSSEFACRFERSDWPLRAMELTFIDFPGERVADVAIAAHRTFAEWSDHLLGHIEAHAEYRRPAADFLALVGGDGKMADAAVTDAFKLALARFIMEFKPLVTPSVFLLDTDGSQARGTTPEEVASGRRIGVRPGELDGSGASFGFGPDDPAPAAGEFAPLPAAARAANPKLAEAYAARYRAYREQIALPFFARLKGCQRVMVMVDVTTILAGGHGMFNDTLKIIEDLFSVLRGKSLLAGALDSFLGDFLGFSTGGLEKVAFVAGKLDLIAPVDRGRALDLLREMTRRTAGDLDVPHEWFVTSAIVSTTTPPGASDTARRLVGRLLWDPGTGRRLNPADGKQEFPVSEVPASWPSNWEPETHRFPSVFPDWPAVVAQAPSHINLDAVTRFLLD
jgi:predicted YcjX-like family ATPase